MRKEPHGSSARSTTVCAPAPVTGRRGAGEPPVLLGGHGRPGSGRRGHFPESYVSRRRIGTPMVSCAAPPRRATRWVIAQQQEFPQGAARTPVAYLMPGHGLRRCSHGPEDRSYTHETEDVPGMLVRHCPRPKDLRPGGPLEADQRSTVFERGSAAQRPRTKGFAVTHAPSAQRERGAVEPDDWLT